MVLFAAFIVTWDCVRSF